MLIKKYYEINIDDLKKRCIMRTSLTQSGNEKRNEVIHFDFETDL